MFPQALCHQSHVLTGVKNISHYLTMSQRRGSVARCNIIKELFFSKRTLTAAVTLSPKGINSPTQAGVMSGGILSQERIRNMHLCSLWKNLPACAGASECLMLDIWDVHVTKCRADFSLCCCVLQEASSCTERCCSSSPSSCTSSPSPSPRWSWRSCWWWLWPFRPGTGSWSWASSWAWPVTSPRSSSCTSS